MNPFRAVNAFGVIIVNGTGVIHGFHVRLRFRYLDGSIYNNAQADMQISTDGRHMEGIVYYERAGPRFMRLVMQSSSGDG